MTSWKTLLLAAFVAGLSTAIATEVVERFAAHYWGPKA